MKKGFYSDRKVLVTGGTGLIGRPLVEFLIKQGAHVRIASLDKASRAHPQAEFCCVDLTRFENCMQVCEKMDYVFHLAGVKGSPSVATKKPASFFVPIILFNTNMLEAARQNDVKGLLYTSSIGVYGPAEIFIEDDVWTNFPSENDRFAGWAKRMGELQAQAYEIEFGWQKISIVRPANVYGPHDNFDPKSAMVIPSLISRVLAGEDPFIVWGDGSAVRDFIHAKDVARGMLLAVEQGMNQPINLGSGIGITIKKVVEIILSHLDKKIDVIWDASKPAGDEKRLMDISRAKSMGWQPSVSIEEGIGETMKWYKENQNSHITERYNIFTAPKLV